jgi:outer membrane protein TolC
MKGIRRLIYLLILPINMAVAQQAFNLKQAQDYAKLHSYLIQDADLEIEKSRKKIQETIAIGLPQINANFDYQYFRELPQNIIDVSAFDPTLDGPIYQKIAFGQKYFGTASLKVDQKIFDGSYIVGLQATKVYLRLSEDQKEKREIDVVAAVYQAYSGVLIAGRNKVILQESIEELKKTYAETKALYEEGFVEESDVDQIELLLLNSINSFEQAKRQELLSVDLLKFNMGIPIEQTIQLTNTLDELLTMSNGEIPLERGFDFNSHIDYKILKTQEEASKLTLKNAKAQFLPTLSAFYNLQQVYSSDEDKITFGGGFEWTRSQIIGFSFKMPIFNSMKKFRVVEQAQLDFDKTQVAKEQVKESLSLAAKTAKSDYSFYRSKLKNELKNLEIAKRIRNKTQIKFNEGVSTSLELSQVENQYLQTQGQYIQSLFQLFDSKSKLDKALNNY